MEVETNNGGLVSQVLQVMDSRGMMELEDNNVVIVVVWLARDCRYWTLEVMMEDENNGVIKVAWSARDYR